MEPTDEYKEFAYDQRTVQGRISAFRDPYELSNGHAILYLPTGGWGAHAKLLGGIVLDSDPAVAEAGVDTGFASEPPGPN